MCVCVTEYVCVCVCVFVCVCGCVCSPKSGTGTMKGFQDLDREKILHLGGDSNPRPLTHRDDALPTELAEIPGAERAPEVVFLMSSN